MVTKQEFYEAIYSVQRWAKSNWEDWEGICCTCNQKLSPQECRRIFKTLVEESKTNKVFDIVILIIYTNYRDILEEDLQY